MNLFELLLLSIALSMDSFTISLTCGVVLKRFNWRNALRIAFIMAFVQASFIFCGKLLGTGFQDLLADYDHWIALALLTVIGINMIKEAYSDEENEVLRDFRFSTILLMAVATSIDAGVTGITLGFMEDSFSMVTLMVFLVTFLFCIVALFLGCRLGHRLPFKVGILGGVILIALGVKTVVEHVMC